MSIRSLPMISGVDKKGLLLPLILLLPTVLLMTVTVIGYLYFTQQQIRSTLIADEFHVVTRAAQTVQQVLSDAHSHAVSVATDFVSGGDDLDAQFQSERMEQRIQELFDTNREYVLASVIDVSGTELLRFEFEDGVARTVSAQRLLANAGPLLVKINAALGQQPLTSTFLPLINETGIVIPRQPVLTTIMRQSTGTVLVTSRRVDDLLAGLEQEISGATGELWLLNADGTLVAGGRPGEGIEFLFDPPQADDVAMRLPAVWGAVNQAFSGTAAVAEGQIAFTWICGRLNCETSAANSLGPLSSGWKLISLVPQSQLTPWSLLANHPDRWLPMFGLLLIVTLISATGAWFIGSMLLVQRRRDGQLKQADLLQHAFFEKNPEIMFVKNLDGTYFFANEMCRRLAGQPEADFSGRTGEDLFPEDASAIMSQQDVQVIENQEPMEFHSHWQREGELAYFKTLRFPIYDEQHKLVAIGGIANDVTEQVYSRHALLENEKLLKTFIESAPDAVLISDIHGRVSLVNRQAELIFGYDRDEMLQKSLFDLVVGFSADRIRDALQSADESKGHVFRELIQSTGRGSEDRVFPVEFSLAPVTTDEGALIICLLRDTSEKALIETQLRQSQKMEAVGKLTGGMAHDFNNLLGIIIGNIALALKQLPVGDEKLEKRLNTVMKAADRGAELTKRMLAIARRQPLQPKPVVINDVVSELSQMLPQTLGSDIEMELQLTPGLPSILVDESGFEAMLLNLAINSRDAMPQGGTFSIFTDRVDHGVVEKALPSTRIEKTEFIHILVRDTGEGMGEEALSKAFEPFFTTKEKDKGTGLGLAMIYGFVKQSRGFIVLDSSRGVGTSVHIYLPVMDAEQTDLVEGVQDGEHAGPVGDGRVALLVDDESELLQIAETYFRDLGFKVACASSGREALTVLEELGTIDLLFTDVVMPGGMNGVALAREVMERVPSVTVLYASGFPTGIIEENSKIVLDAPLLLKPYSLNALSKAIGEVLGHTLTG